MEIDAVNFLCRLTQDTQMIETTSRVVRCVLRFLQSDFGWVREKKREISAASKRTSPWWTSPRSWWSVKFAQKQIHIIPGVGWRWETLSPIQFTWSLIAYTRVYLHFTPPYVVVLLVLVQISFHATDWGRQGRPHHYFKAVASSQQPPGRQGTKVWEWKLHR
jgi:hypothetical protein